MTNRKGATKRADIQHLSNSVAEIGHAASRARRVTTLHQPSRHRLGRLARDAAQVFRRVRNLKVAHRSSVFDVVFDDRDRARSLVYGEAA